MSWLRCLPGVVATLLAAGQALAQQPADTAYSRQIRALTSEPRFNTELTDHLPADPVVPSPLKVLGYVPGTIGRLSHVADINRYFRALAAATPRVRIFDIGRSDEGREMIIAAIADSATVASLDTYRDVTRRLADPRGLSEAEARALLVRGKPVYWLTGSIHSPETGSPEMLMELAYRLAVEDSPRIRSIREHVVTLITPVSEVDGRDRMVDVYNYGRAHHGVRPPLVYWGRYTAHDNNRDGMVLSQTLTRNMLAAYFAWHPTVLHDLHESVPFLYTSTGTGPYNRAIDAITIDEWHQLSYFEIEELTRRGLPGVWTHGFYDGWAPNYMMFIANLRNSIGRFYETYTSFGAECDTARIRAQQRSVEWYRPNPPLDGVRWCIRNNINYQESGAILALGYVAERAGQFLDNFWVKSRRAVERGRTGTPNLWHIPANQPRRVEAAELVNLLRLQGIEVQRADAAFTAGGVSIDAGDYLVRMDQPYGPLAADLLGVQTYRPSDPMPYDDTGWTFGWLRNVAVHPIADTGALSRPMTPITADVVVRGAVGGEGPGARGAFLIPATTESNLIVFRYRLKDARMYAAEDTFTVDGRAYQAGTVIVPVAEAGRDGERPLRDALESLGLTAFATRDVPAVDRHELDLPRLGLVHSWLNTQNEGWVRYALDHFAIPYMYLSTQRLQDSALLSHFDVLLLPYVGGDARTIVNGLPPAGPPIPWRKSPQTPNLGVYDSTDDVRPGIGLTGMSRLQQWIRAGGVLITEGGTAALPIDFGLVPGVNIVESRQLRARGSVVRAVVHDRASPIVYGYSDTMAVYFSQSPLFRVDSAAQRGTEREQDSAAVLELRRLRPRVVLEFEPRADSLLLSGLMVGGSELAGRPAVVDVAAGRGHVVLFANRPMWRWETQGSFALVFNTLLNWRHLGVSWPAPEGRKSSPVQGPGNRRRATRQPTGRP
jgi:hypothetical protein